MMRHESPAERFARRQAERAAERAPIVEAAEQLAKLGPLGMYPKGGQLARLRAAIEQGCGVNEAARVTGCSRQRARKMNRIVAAERLRAGLPLPKCACGQVATHRAWCAVRLQASARRQAVMAELHARQRCG